ncbi:MAG: hypothetical protein HY026_02440 [Deltaproteobacteria bacterium]|nr:hypothetical protein [Deltaproteobacteria bacterium]
MKRTAGLLEDDVLERLEWLIYIRWAAIVFIIAATLIAINIFKVGLPILPLYLIALFIAVYNTGFKIYLKQIKGKTPSVVNARRFSIIQSMLDIISLILLIHFTGGAENPFIFYFIFHTILTSLLLSKRNSYIQAGIICILAVGLFMLEYVGILPHHSIKGFLGTDLYKNITYTAAISFVFISTIFIATFFTVSVSKKLKESNLKLHEMDRLKDEYVKMVSHDLKSPLASIQSLLEVMLGGFAGPVDEKVKEILQRIQKKIGFLHHYTKDLLDLSRIRAEKNLNLKKFNIKEVIDTAVEIAMPKMGEKEIELDIEIPDNFPTVAADKEQITYVFLNLIANAFKYTPSGGKVQVTVSQKNDTIIAEVTDTGIGIPPQDLPHIFEEFFRASNVVKATKGTGLGLSLVKHIIERHNGNILIESELGKGTAFRFTLPIDKDVGQVKRLE